jgi:hypothetical protein
VDAFTPVTRLCGGLFSGTASCRAGRRTKTRKNNMARKPGTRSGGEFALFDVIYEDGSQRSNRRVPVALLGGLDGDEPAKAELARQDREIAEKSGRPALVIKAVKRAGSK